MATRRPRPSNRTSGTRSDPAPARSPRRSARGAARAVSSSAPAKPAKAPRLPKAVATAVEAARDKKALDTVVLDLRKADGFTDYFVICSAANARQIAAIADAVQETLRKQLDERPAVAEGMKSSEWILLDYFNFVVHIFSRECRSFYGLERLWGNADRYDFSDETA
jgi:ribosome-associated protein